MAGPSENQSLATEKARKRTSVASQGEYDRVHAIGAMLSSTTHYHGAKNNLCPMLGRMSAVAKWKWITSPFYFQYVTMF